MICLWLAGWQKPGLSAQRRLKPSVSSTFDLFEILLILAIALIVIGPEQMPTVLRAVARIIREVRLATNEVMRELTEALEEDDPRKQRPATPPAEEHRPAEPPPSQSQP